MNKITSVFLTLLLFSSSAFALTTFTSIGSGAYLAPGTWNQSGAPVDADGIPDGNDIVIISPLHTVSVSVNSSACNAITVNGTLQFTANVVMIVTGSYTMAGAESGTGTLRFDGSGALTVTGTVSTSLVYHFNSNRTISALSVINKYGSITRISNNAIVTNLGTCTIGSVTAYAASKWINGAGSNLTLRVLGFMNAGLFDPSGAGNTVTLTYNGSSVPKTVNGYYNLITTTSTKSLGENAVIAGSLTINSGASLAAGTYTMSVAGDWSNSGTFTAGTGTVTFNGSGPQGIGGTSVTGFYRLTINSGNTVTLNVNTVVSNLLTMTAGTFSTGVFSLTGAGGITATGGDLQLGRLTTVPELAGAYSLTGGIVTFNGAGAQTIRGAISYFDIVAAGAGTKTAGGALNINGSVTISSTLDVSASNFALSCAGNWTNNGTYTARNGTVTFDGITTVGGASTTSFYNVTITGTLTGSAATMNVSRNWVNNGTYTHNSGTVVFNGTTIVSGASTTSFNNVTISGTLTGHATTMNVAGNWSNGGTYTHNSGTVVFNGATTVSGASTTTFNDITITGTLTGHATNMNLVGDYVNNGTFANNGGTLTFNGTAVQTISGTSSTTFENLTINNTAGVGTGVSITSGSYVLDGGLTMSNGTLSTGGNSFTMTSTAGKTAYIAQITGTGAITGNFNIQSYLRSGAASWADIAAPVNTTFGDWAAGLPAISYSTYPTQYRYNAATDNFIGIKSAAAAFSPGVGIEVYLSGDYNYGFFGGAIVTTTGVPTQGNQVIAINGASNLVGNPFACSISAAAAGIGAYDIMDAGNYVAGGAEIPSGQGFWFYGGALTIPESAKTTTATGNVRSEVIEEPYFTLKLSSEEYNVPFTHILKVAASATASNGWNSDEEHLYRKTPVKEAPSLYTTVDDKKVIINKFNNSNETYSMPVSLKIGISGNYKLEVSNLESMSDYPSIKLEDRFLNKIIDLTKDHSYSFKINAVDESDRFVVHFSKSKDSEVLTSTPMVAGFANQVEVLPSPQGNIINFNLAETIHTTITATNVIGQTIIDAIAVDANSQSVSISLPEDYHGMYILNIYSSKGNIIKKFIKN